MCLLAGSIALTHVCGNGGMASDGIFVRHSRLRDFGRACRREVNCPNESLGTFFLRSPVGFISNQARAVERFRRNDSYGNGSCARLSHSSTTPSRSRASLEYPASSIRLCI